MPRLRLIMKYAPPPLTLVFVAIAEIENAVALAQAQADSVAASVVEQGGPDRLATKEIVAMTAYLQSLRAHWVDAAPEAGPAGASGETAAIVNTSSAN